MTDIPTADTVVATPTAPPSRKKKKKKGGGGSCQTSTIEDAKFGPLFGPFVYIQIYMDMDIDDRYANGQHRVGNSNRTTLMNTSRRVGGSCQTSTIKDAKVDEYGYGYRWYRYTIGRHRVGNSDRASLQDEK